MKKYIYIQIVFLFQICVSNAQITKDSLIKLIKYTYSNQYNFDKAYLLSKKTIQYALGFKDTLLIIKSYQNMADVLWYGSIYGEAEGYYFKSLEIGDSAKYTHEYAYALYGIGWIECIQKGKREKLSLLYRAYRIYRLLKDTTNTIVLSNALSGAYQEFYNQDTSQKYYLDSAINILYSVINITDNSKTWKRKMLHIHANLAQELIQRRDYQNAYKVINKYFSNIRDTINRRSFINAILIKSHILNKLHYKDSARYLIKKYYDEIISFKDNETLEDFYRLLYEFSKEDKNYEKALYYLEKHRDIKDKINKELLSVKYEELEANKELFKKEQSLIALQKENEIHQIKSRQKTYYLIIAIVFILIVIYFLLKTLRQNENIRKLNNEIVHQKDLIEQKNKDIIDSINYAFRIQKALITSEEYIQKHFLEEKYFAEYFVLYIPKDIVSGDFYWANVNVQHVNQPHYFAVCDCTGHGVPGAFMSLLNINFLNEAIIEKQLYYPHEVFNYVREKLLSRLSYDEQQKDGMDASLIMMDKEFLSSRKMYYTLANHQMILIRNGEMSIISGDKMPVGFSYGEESFTLKEMKMEKGDWLYLFTDGYKDQFGGEKGKRMMQRRFSELVQEINKYESKKQKEELEKFFREWKRENEQTDDVCVVGIKV